MDGAAEVEDDGAGSFFLDGPSQRALNRLLVVAVVVERGDVVNAASASAGGVHAEALGAGEGGSLLLLCQTIGGL